MKYKVLKEFINKFGVYYQPGDTYIDPSGITTYRGLLLDHGFIEEIKDEPWKPKPLIDTYYTIELGDEVDAHLWTGNELDKAYTEIGNCFQTKEQADKALEWLKAFKVLRDDMKGFKPSFNDYQKCVYYDKEDNKLMTGPSHRERHTIIYFANYEDAEESIKKHEKEWLIFLGIEDEQKK